MNLCPICKSVETDFLENFENPLLPNSKLSFFSCKYCGILFYDPLPSVDYSIIWEEEYYDKFYIEYDAGLIFMSSLLFPIKDKTFENMLEIGCGLGFILDMAKEMIDVKNLKGIEPSYLKRTKLFPYEIISGFFPESISENDEQFDLIICSEVIEHTPNPLYFLENLGAKLREEGIAIITTPNADAFFREGRIDKLGIAGPGQHTIIFSINFLEKIFDNLKIPYKIFLSEGKTGLKSIIIYLTKKKSFLEHIEYYKPTHSEVLNFLEFLP